MASLARAAGNGLHQPVLAGECLELLSPALESRGSVLIDGTLGLGGHSEAFLTAFPHIRVIGIDRDSHAISLACERLEAYGDRFRAIKATYDDIDSIAGQYGRDGKADAILMDLGVSSLQLDDASRGFSYAQDAPLDMRMDSSSPISAADLLNTADATELAAILRDYGDERYATRIAKNIVAARAEKPLESTSELVDIVRASIPAPARRTGGHPAKRTFQAIRIAVNEELSILERAITRALDSLHVSGRIAVESYQSLEDRIVKRAFARASTSTTPARLPVELEGHEAAFALLTRGAIKASPEEIEANPRSASVRLRAAQRIREGRTSS